MWCQRELRHLALGRDRGGDQRVSGERGRRPQDQRNRRNEEISKGALPQEPDGENQRGGGRGGRIRRFGDTLDQDDEENDDNNGENNEEGSEDDTDEGSDIA